MTFVAGRSRLPSRRACTLARRYRSDEAGRKAVAGGLVAGRRGRAGDPHFGMRLVNARCRATEDDDHRNVSDVHHPFGSSCCRALGLPLRMVSLRKCPDQREPVGPSAGRDDGRPAASKREGQPPGRPDAGNRRDAARPRCIPRLRRCRRRRRRSWTVRTARTNSFTRRRTSPCRQSPHRKTMA